MQSFLKELEEQVQADIERAWADEIEQRIAAFDRGEISAHSAEDVFADARRSLRLEAGD